MLPDIRLEADHVGDMLVGYHQRRTLRSIPKHLWASLRCRFRGHEWSPWTLDDMDGPKETIGEGDEEFEIPLLSRESRPGEYGERHCRRRCGAHEQRYPIAEAPELWQKAAL